MTAALRRVLLVWLALLLLLAATLGAAFLPLGPAKPWIGYGIAALKAGLILWFFMDMRREGGLMRLATGAALLWIVFLLSLVASDYLTRSVPLAPAQPTGSEARHQAWLAPPRHSASDRRWTLTICFAAISALRT